jgi:Lhr-like helicase
MNGPREGATSEDPAQREGVSMDTKTILENAERDEARRTILREAIDRFNHELMDDEERMLLLDRIKKLRIRLALS